MIAIAWQALRARWMHFAGSFLALALGVALFTAAGLTLAAALHGPDDPPRWFLTPSVVVAGPAGAAGATPALPPGERGHVPAGVVTALSTVDNAARIVVDRAGYAQSGSATEAHPWSASALHPFRFVAGTAPTAANHVVVTAPTDAHPGDTVSVATAVGPQRFTVSGVIESPAEPALYVTDVTASRLAQDRIAAVVLLPRPGIDVEELAGQVDKALEGFPHVRVLTGDDRRSAELDPDAGLEAATASLVGSTAGMAGFVAAFVVASTSAFVVAQRRREFALLRAAGATPRQVRRIIAGEAVLIGALAAIAGAALGTVLAPMFAAWLAHNGLAPADFAVRFVWWPPAVAFVLGLVVALCGTWLAARRAGKVRPIEALSEASIERRAMTITRWVLGLACLGGVFPLAQLMSGPAGAAYLLLVVMLLIVSCALLVPVLMRPFARLLTGGRGPIAMLARASAQTERRRYASTIAPVLITVGLAGSTLIGTATISAAEAAALRDHLTAPVMVTAAGQVRLPVTAADRAREVPGVVAAVPVKATTVFDSDRDMMRQLSAWYSDGPATTAVLAVPVVAGSFEHLTGNGVAVAASIAGAHGWRVGDQARLWLNDGAVTDLLLVAIYDDRLGLPDTFLPWSLTAAHSTTPLPDAIYLGLDPSVKQMANQMANRMAVEAAVAPLGGTVTETATHLTTLDEEFDRLNRLSLLAVLGMALVYTAVFIANTQLMATTGRAQELRTLRRVGATRRQILRLVGREAVTVWAIGTALGGLITIATLITIHIVLGGLADSVPTRVPWLPILVITACCGVITTATSAAAASRI